MALRSMTVATVESIFKTVVASATPTKNGKRQYQNPNGVLLAIQRSVPAISLQMIRNHVDALCDAGYLEKVFMGRTITALEVERDVWDGMQDDPKPRALRKKLSSHAAVADPQPEAASINAHPESQPAMAKPVSPPIATETMRPWQRGGKPRILMVVDWSNILRNIGSPLGAIHQILDVEKRLFNTGDIEIKFLFVPDNEIDLVGSLASTHRYFVVACPPTFTKNSIRHYKEKDGVDTRMTLMIHIIALFNSGITHVVILSGDGDFTDAAVYAKNHGRRVIVACLLKTLSAELEDVVDEMMLMRKP